MKRSIFLTILRILVTFLWRLALTVAVIGGLCILGGALVLNMIFNGPSETARDQLTLTLLESSYTRSIPGYFLSDAVIAQISGVDSFTGCSDAELIQLSAVGDAETVTLTTTNYTAQVTLYTDSTALRLTAGSAIDGSHRVGISPSGVLLISDDFRDLLFSSSIPCGPVLIQNGIVNEALFTGSSGYAPRAAIGQAADGTLIFITTDGWTQTHLGATSQDIINLMVEYGAVNAALLSRDALLTESAESEG